MDERIPTEVAANIAPLVPPALVPLADPGLGRPLVTATSQPTLLPSQADRLDFDELHVARALQQSNLPTGLPSIPGFDLSGFSRTAADSCGDFYDATACADGTFCLAISDVMGSGFQAAQIAARIKGIFRALAQPGVGPGRLITRMNRMLYGQLCKLETFATFQVISLNPLYRTLTIANAGHCPVLVGDMESVRAVAAEGFPIGIEEEFDYTEETISLGLETHALLYTDGVTEASDFFGERLGQDRLADWFRDALREQLKAGVITTRLLASLQTFEGKQAVQDDQTALVLAPASLCE